MRNQLVAYLPSLRRYAHALSGSAADAEDLVQDCIETALSHEGSWRGRNLRAWLFTILTNCHRNALRTRSRRPRTTPLEAASHVVAQGVEPDPLAEDRVVRALGLISEEGREVLLLVALEGCTYREVAEIADIPLGTVMSRLSRARRQLSDILRGDNIYPLKARE